MTRMAGSIKGLNSFLGTKPDYTAQGGQSIKGNAEEFMKRTEGNAMVSNAGLKAAADVAAAQHYADAQVAAGQAQGQASMVGGIAGAIGGLGGLFGGGGGGGFGSVATKGAFGIGSAAAAGPRF